MPPNIMASTDAHRRWMTGDAQRELGAMPTRLNDLYGESKLDPLPGRTSCSQTTLQLYVATQDVTSNGRLEVSNALAPNVVLSGLAYWRLFSTKNCYVKLDRIRLEAEEFSASRLAVWAEQESV